MRGPFNWGGRPYFFWKIWQPFLVITVHVLAVSVLLKTGDLFLLITLFSLRGHPLFHYFRHMQKFAALFCGGPFLAEHAEHA